MKITNEEIEKDLEVCERATKEPWIARVITEREHGSPTVCSAASPWTYSEGWDRYYGEIVPKQTKCDATFIAFARTRWPLYIKELQEVKEELAELKRRIEGLEK